MKEFTSNETVNIKDEGKIFIVTNDVDRKKGGERTVGLAVDFEDLYPEVKIDGKVYETAGVESFAISFISKGSPIGIHVK